MMADRKLAKYMQHVFEDLEKDSDTTRALRRIHIKQVHLKRKGNYDGFNFVKKARRLI